MEEEAEEMGHKPLFVSCEIIPRCDRFTGLDCRSNDHIPTYIIPRRFSHHTELLVTPTDCALFSQSADAKATQLVS